jgi:hypothetical protein
MIEKIFNKLGYYKSGDVRDLGDNPLTEAELGSMYAESIGDISEYVIDKDQELLLFKDLATIDGLGSYLRATVAKDMQRYFAAEDDRQRNIIRGAMSRTMFFRSSLRSKSNDKTTKVEGINYKRNLRA